MEKKSRAEINDEITREILKMINGLERSQNLAIIEKVKEHIDKYSVLSLDFK